MNPDDLQRWASLLRWTGLIVTAIGLVITFGSHYIADRLMVAQRTDKAKAEERVRSTEAELRDTKAKTEELEKSANVIRSLELYVDLYIPTAPKPVTDAGTDVGLQSTVALFTQDKTRHRFSTDFKLTDQQISERVRKLSFVYQPESPNEIYGRPIDYLKHIDVFACRFGDILKEEHAEFAGPGKLDLRLLLNGVEVVDLRNQEGDPRVLLDQQAMLPVAEAFQAIPTVYQERLRERR
jgi:hypothetical protein